MPIINVCNSMIKDIETVLNSAVFCSTNAKHTSKLIMPYNRGSCNKVIFTVSINGIEKLSPFIIKFKK